MSKLSWYWHRLRVMGAREIALHGRKKLRQIVDSQRTTWPALDLTTSRVYPRLPNPADAPMELRSALHRDAHEIIAGRWRFFGHLEVQVDDPPRWQCDYLAQRDMRSTASAFNLNYRTLPPGVDSKLIWEPSRWNQLVRLAMAAYVLEDPQALQKCLKWLDHWVRENPPYRGWNWTSAIEVGMRLIQFAWIDALLDAIATREAPPGRPAPDPLASVIIIPLSPLLERLRQSILPSHAWYAWRHRSFGSSANNHLLAELAGCIVATARWPGLAAVGPSLDELQGLWEREVIAQFEEDGANREQALNYQLFSWELCWQAMHALTSAGRTVCEPVYLRIFQAADFFVQVQAGAESWDYGDSDGACVTPFFLDEAKAGCEWREWLLGRKKSAGLEYWMSECRTALRDQVGCSKAPVIDSTARHMSTSAVSAKLDGWIHYAKSGYCIVHHGSWMLRWDLSPLGYLSTAAHGHLDALHLSIWIKKVALVIDPGTGAYHADGNLRTWLASRRAHNAPCPARVEFPRRVGPFLWEERHEKPRLELLGKLAMATLPLPGVTLRRSIRHLPEQDGWEVADACARMDGSAETFIVRWQFAPGSWVRRVTDRRFRVCRADVEVLIEAGEEWNEVELVEPISAIPGEEPSAMSGDSDSLEGIVSPAFRKVCRAPFLRLTARGDKPCVFTTTFLASAHS